MYRPIWPPIDFELAGVLNKTAPRTPRNGFNTATSLVPDQRLSQPYLYSAPFPEFFEYFQPPSNYDICLIIHPTPIIPPYLL